MDPGVAVFVIINALALLLLPRRWAALPLIAGPCFMTRSQTIEIGDATLTVVRLLISVGLIRLIIRREWIRGGVYGLDGLLIAWGLWMIVSVVFHPQPDPTFVARVRDAYDAWGLYLLFRVFCRSREDLQYIARILVVSLVPIAIAMVSERVTGMNVFSRFGGVPELSPVRNGVVRAQGPFAHAILAGSIGAVCLPLVVSLWRERRFLAAVGITACVAIVITSGSSGPLLAAGAGIGALLLWPLCHRMRVVRWAGVCGYLALELVMNRPAYFIISDLDLMGGSTSWHRAELIRSAFTHLDEWWLVGTDYTRHWMATGLSAHPNQADITNHFIGMGVVGGLPLMLIFIGLLLRAFWNIGAAIQSDNRADSRYRSWAVGASLFAHAATCLSVSYFDHSVMFLYLALAASTAMLSTVSCSEHAPDHLPRRTTNIRRVYGLQELTVRAPARRGGHVAGMAFRHQQGARTKFGHRP